MKLYKDGTIEGTPEEIAAYVDRKKDNVFDVIFKKVNGKKSIETIAAPQTSGAYTLQEQWVNGVRFIRVNNGPWKETPGCVMM